MDNIIIVIIALLVGAGLTFFLTTKLKIIKKSNDITQVQENDLSGNKSEKEEVDLNENIPNLHYEISDLEKEKKKFAETNPWDEVKLVNAENEKNRLEKEIDDLEDEISDLGKRNKRIKEENNQLDDKLYCLEKEKRRILETSRDNEEKLNKVIKANSKQKESLDFVSDILNANNATNEEFREVYDKTSEILYFIEENLRYPLSYLGNNIIDYDYLNKCWNWRNQEIKTWIKNKKVVAVVGEFSAGKTSIVNRILKQDNPNALELPVKSTETTAIPTYISKGKDFNCQFYSPSGDLKNISSTSFLKVTKSVLDDINISSIVKYFVLSYKNENLSNISILDTPGFGSTSEEIISKTTEVVKEADALLWVIDANTGEINNSSMNVLKENLNGVPLYIIINKSDTKSQKDLDTLKNKIEETLIRNNIDYQQVIPFSHKMKADCLLSIINSISPKENPNVTSELRDQIGLTLVNAKKELKELKTEEIDLSNNGDSKSNILSELMIDIEYSVKDIERVIKFEDSFWREEYYKISKNDYKKFDAGKKKIVSANKELPYSIDKFIDILKLHSDKKEEVFEKKRDIKNLEDSKTEFIRLLGDYDQSQKTRNSKIIK